MPPRSDLFQHLGRLGKSPRLLLGVDLSSVDEDVKDPTAALDELRFEPPLLPNRSRQTGGLGKKVSSRAVGDRNPHPGPSFTRG